MIFQFSHGENLCTAYVIYEPAQVRDTMIVYLLDFNNELGYEIIFYEYEPLRWKTNANFRTEYPHTYRSLSIKLEEIFLDYKFLFEPASVQQESE
jgi:hypothetical protein